METNEKTQQAKRRAKDSINNLIRAAVRKGDKSPLNVSMGNGRVMYDPKDGDAIWGVPTCCLDNDF